LTFFAIFLWLALNKQLTSLLEFLIPSLVPDLFFRFDCLFAGRSSVDYEPTQRNSETRKEKELARKENHQQANSGDSSDSRRLSFGQGESSWLDRDLEKRHTTTELKQNRSTHLPTHHPHYCSFRPLLLLCRRAYPVVPFPFPFSSFFIPLDTRYACVSGLISPHHGTICTYKPKPPLGLRSRTGQSQTRSCTQQQQQQKTRQATFPRFTPFLALSPLAPLSALLCRLCRRRLQYAVHHSA
jgi:hypothetical protein